MRHRLGLLLLLSLLASCGPARPQAPSAARPRVLAELAYVGPLAGAQAAGANAFDLALRQAGGSGGTGPRLSGVRLGTDCSDASEAQGALAAGADPAISAAVVYDCGDGAPAAVAMVRRLRLPAVLWGQGLRAVTWIGPPAATQPAGAALARFVADFDARAGLTPVACLDAASFCDQLAAARPGSVLPLRGRSPAALLPEIAAARPAAVWTGDPPAAAAALRRLLARAGVPAVLEGSALYSPAYPPAAGAPAEGTIAFVPGPPQADRAALARFLSLYAAAGLRPAPGPETPEAYAAVQVLTAAVAHAGVRRTAIARYLAAGVHGLPTVVGSVGFDAAGGRTAAPPAAYVVRGGAWVPWTPPATVSGSVYAR